MEVEAISFHENYATLFNVQHFGYLFASGVGLEAGRLLCENVQALIDEVTT